MLCQNVVTSHPYSWDRPLHTTEQIESASQLKHHTYLIQPVIRGYALLPLHNTLSMSVTPAPTEVEPRHCHFTYCTPQPTLPPGSLLFVILLLSVIVESFLQGLNTKVHITHIIMSAYYVNAHISDHSEGGEKKKKT